MFPFMQNPFMQMQQMLSVLSQNPGAMLQKAGFTVPNGISSPQQIVQHLVNSGQIPQARVQQAMQMLGMR